MDAETGSARHFLGPEARHLVSVTVFQGPGRDRKLTLVSRLKL